MAGPAGGATDGIARRVAARPGVALGTDVVDNQARPYDLVADFAPLGFIGSSASVLVVPTDGPGTLGALLAPAGTSPVTYGSTGIGATASAVAPCIAAGRLRPLAVASNQRSRFFPDVPTFKELNYPSVEQEGWFGLFAAAGTPAEVVKRLNGHLNQALADPTVRSGREHRYVEVGTPGGPDRFRSCVAKEATHWSKVVADSGAKAE